MEGKMVLAIRGERGFGLGRRGNTCRQSPGAGFATSRRLRCCSSTKCLKSEVGVLDERHYYSSCAVQPSYPHNITITFIVIVAIIISVIVIIFINIFIIASDGRKALLKLHNPRTATISALARRGKQRKNCPKLDSLRTIVQTQHKEVMYRDILH